MNTPTDWTIPELTYYENSFPRAVTTPAPKLTAGHIKNLIRNKQIHAYKNKNGHWRIPEQAGHDLHNQWHKEWQTCRGKKSEWITSEEVNQRWGVDPTRILYARRNMPTITKTTICGQQVYNREEFQTLSTKNGFFETKELEKLAEKGLEPCLYSGCNNPAPQQPEGYGIRFCKLHLPNWEKVRDQPRNSAKQTFFEQQLENTQGHTTLAA